MTLASSEILNDTFFGNTVLAYALALSAFVGGLAVIAVARFFVLRRLKAWAARTTTTLDDFLIASLEKSAVPLLYFGAFYLSATSLALAPVLAKVLRVAAAVWLTVSGIRFLIETVTYALTTYWARRGEDGREQLLAGLTPILKVLLWGLGLVFLLDNLGYKVSTMLAGLGIGGMALALAAQAVLGDLFSYFAIMFDRPFAVGDFIVVGPDHMGTIEHIGVKTTRVRSLSGEELVISNADLTGSRVRNFKRMASRRVLFKVGVTYETPLETLKEIPAVLRSAVERQKDVTFDRAHFESFGDSALMFEVVYILRSAEYNRHMDVRQAVNFLIKEEFDKRGISIAYPTQTLYMARAPRPS